MRYQSLLWAFSWVVFFGAGYVLGLDQESASVESNQAPVDEAGEVSAVAATAYEETIVKPRLLNAEETATISLFEEAAPSVAFINTSNYRQNYWTSDISEIPRGSGTGFVWDKQGHIVTNFHVIEDADKATVTLSDQSTWKADLVGYAPEKDLAILKISAPRNKLVPIPLGESADLMVGQSVYAIGNPFGLDQTLTTGIISALGREIKSRSGIPIRDVIQTDAAINPGNSGGPLLDSQGKLIGVNTAIFSPSGAYAGIGFSIPVDQVSWVVPDLIKYGKVKRLSLGVEFWPQNYITRAGIEGAVVLSVQEGSVAERAGLVPTRRNRRGQIVLGDIIVRINKEEIKTSSDLTLALERFKGGDTVAVRVLRGDDQVDLKLVLDPPH